jgi:hypothetical protein
MMGWSRPSRQPKMPASHYYAHIYYEDHDYPDETSRSYNGYNHR